MNILAAWIFHRLQGAKLQRRLRPVFKIYLLYPQRSHDRYCARPRVIASFFRVGKVLSSPPESGAKSAPVQWCWEDSDGKFIRDFNGSTHTESFSSLALGKINFMLMKISWKTHEHKRRLAQRRGKSRSRAEVPPQKHYVLTLRVVPSLPLRFFFPRFSSFVQFSNVLCTVDPDSSDLLECTWSRETPTRCQNRHSLALTHSSLKIAFLTWTKLFSPPPTPFSFPFCLKRIPWITNYTL